MADTVDAVVADPPPPPPPANVDPPPVETAIPVEEEPPAEKGCFAKRSGIEKALIVIVIIVLLLIIGVAIAFVVYFFFSKPPQGTCLTDGCVESASRLKSHMEDTLDPCNSFYKFACHGWSKKQVLGIDQTKIDVETQLQSEHLVKLRTLLSVAPDRDEPEFSKKSKLFYQSCLNTNKLNELGIAPFLEVIDKVGKFPSLDSTWNVTNGDFNFKDMLIKLAALSSLPFFQINVASAGPESERNIIYLSDAKLGLGNRDFYTGSIISKERAEYHQWMVNALVLLGADQEVAEEDAQNVIDFEIKLAEMMRGNEEKASFTSVYTKMDVDTLQVKYPWIQWLELLQGITSFGDGGVGVYIGKDEMVTVQEPKYFSKLGPLINMTSKRVLANYMMSQLLPLTDNMGSDFIRNSETFYENVFNKETLLQWKYCAQLTESKFADAVSRMFVEKYFSKDAKKYVDVVVGDAIDVLKHELEDNSWMGDDAKKMSLAKLDNLEVKIGYPDELYDNEALVKKYKDVTVNEHRYLENHLSLLKYKAVENMKLLRQGANNDQWTVTPTDLTGSYSVENNELVLPAGFLQSPIFNPEFSDAMNYASVASVVGREIIHGFDKIGQNYDAKGNKKSWWDARDTEGFDSRSACFIKQWGCYKWDGLSMNGEKTLAENIAYNAGLKHAYQAYLNRIERKGSEEMRLPGMTLNNHQIFFLSYAQLWCAKYGNEAKLEFLESSVHPPFPYRVFGTLQNSEEFAEAFKCDIGTRMNPREKCSIW